MAEATTEETAQLVETAQTPEISSEPAPTYRYYVTPGPASWVVREESTGALVTAQPLLSESEARTMADRWNRLQAAPGR